MAQRAKALPPEEDTELPKKVSEEDARAAHLIELGFTKGQAGTLSRIRGLSPAQIRETYLKKGCSHELAWRILT